MALPPELLPLTTTAEPISTVTPTLAKLPHLLPTAELLLPLLPALTPTIVGYQDLQAIRTAALLQDPLATAATTTLQDLLATITTPIIAAATPDRPIVLPTVPVAETTATLTPDPPVDQAALPVAIQDLPTVLPTTPAAEAAVHTPDPPADQEALPVAIQDLPEVRVAVIRVAVALQEAPSQVAVQEETLQEDKYRIQNTKFKSISS